MEKILAMTPNEETVKQIIAAHNQEQITKVTRFPTGLHHYVFDVETPSNQYVVRLTLLAEKKHFEGALYWHDKIYPLGVPLPKIFAADLSCTKIDFPYMVMERLPGVDLGEVYNSLAIQDKKTLATTIYSIHKELDKLPCGNGYGYAFNYEDTFPYSAWRDVVNASLDRSQSRIKKADVFNVDVVDSVRQKADALQMYFDDVLPNPFLHDTTTKNILIENGQLTGIVDVDSLCFGDKLLTLALTNMALLSANKNTDYVQFWLNELKPSAIEQKAFTVYTAQCCVDFMSEVGETFNQNPVNRSEDYCDRLSNILNSLLQQLSD